MTQRGHSHHDSHSHDHDHEHPDSGATHMHHRHSHLGGEKGASWLKLAIFLTAGFAAVEIAAGFWAQSLALLSDAAHMITDVAALMVSAIAIRIAQRPATSHSSYGYLRAEVIGAIINVAIIWTLAALLILEAIERFQSPMPVRGTWVIAVGALGLGVNLFILNRSHHHHHHSAALSAARLHVLSDALGSVGATLSGVLIWQLGWTWMDPVVSLLIALAMVVLSWSILRKTLLVLMEFAPDEINVSAIEKALSAIPGVVDLHDLHVWSLSIGRTAASAHLRVGSADPQEVCRLATELLHSRFKIQHTTLQVERQDSTTAPCVQSCR